LGSSSSATSKAGHSAAPAASGPADGVATFLAELGWREFAWHTAFHRTVARADSELPVSAGMHLHPINARFEVFPWQHPDADELRAWQRGETGFGLIDAGMRELWRTGFMHNRVRMVVASFLAKNLLTDWRVGEAWFWDTLVDADEASNPFNWQWVAGCGADAAPYFRIFNPVTQQQRFDEHGTYVDRWAPDSAMRTELVDLKASRARALNAYNGICH
jgi:deoxyribodipyrimidine photo-lyase